MAKRTEASCPLSRREVVDAYFLEHRGKLLDLAAFLDRVERARADAGDAGDDYRLDALRRGIALLIDGRSDRARRVLELLSDPTAEPIEAAPTKGAAGAWDGVSCHAR